MISQEFQPKKFSDIIGQNETVQILKSIVKNPSDAPKSIILQGKAGSGRCVLPGTRVFTSNGYLPIDSLQDNLESGFQEYTTNVYTREGIKQSSHIYKELDCRVNLLKLENGEYINGTDKHRVLALRNNEIDLHYLSDLQPDDYILFPKVLLGKDWEEDEDWAYLAGAWVANGFSTQYDCRFAGTLEQCKQFAEKAGWSSPPQDYINGLYFVHRGKDSESFNLKGTMTNKVLPEKLFSLGTNSRIMFLQTLLNLKGEVIKSDVVMRFKSEILVKDLQTLLHTLGITAFIDNAKKTDLYIPVKNLVHLNLSINEQPIISKDGIIQFVDGAEVAKLFRVHRRETIINKHVNDFSMTLTNKIKETNQVSFNDLAHYKSLYKSTPDNIELYFYDNIKIITKEFTTSDVYDLSVPEIHEFYCQGTINHNTAISKVFTKALDCTDKSSLEPCGKCDRCLNNTRDNTSPFHRVHSVNNNYYQFFRNINSGLQVYLFKEYDLSEEAQKIVLELIDESFGDSFFLFHVSNSSRLNSQISSMSLELRLKDISKEDLEKQINYISQTKNLDLESELISKIAEYSKGNIQEAYKLLDLYILLGRENFISSLRDPLEFYEQFGYAITKKDKQLLFSSLKELSTFPLPILAESLKEFAYEFMKALTGLPSKVNSALPKAFNSKAIVFTKHLISDWVVQSLRSDIEFQAALMAVFQLMQ